MEICYCLEPSASLAPTWHKLAQIGPNWSKLAQLSNSPPTERDMTSLVSLTEQASRRAHGVVGCSESF